MIGPFAPRCMCEAISVPISNSCCISTCQLKRLVSVSSVKLPKADGWFSERTSSVKEPEKFSISACALGDDIVRSSRGIVAKVFILFSFLW